MREEFDNRFLWMGENFDNETDCLFLNFCPPMFFHGDKQKKNIQIFFYHLFFFYLPC